MQQKMEKKMNANEQAVELEHYLKGEEYDRLVWEIPDLLRQQQAEIEALEARIERMVEDRSKYEALAHAGGVEVGKELKTLTDEEIKQVMSKFYSYNPRLLEFARAILRREQEK